VSEHTIEENILKKARQKRDLQKTVIRQGNFTTDFFSSINLRGLIKDENRDMIKDVDYEDLSTTQTVLDSTGNEDIEKALAAAEDTIDSDAAKQAIAEQIYEAEGEKEFSDDETSEKPSSGRPNWEDSLIPIQRYALNYLEVFNPIDDDEVELLVQKQQKNREEGWKRSQVHNLKKEDIKDRRGKKRKRL
jgi:helicase SWR1